MQRFVLVALRLSLCVWGGVALYFVAVVVPKLNGLLTSRPPLDPARFPAAVLPPYFRFGLALLGLAFLCGCAGLWNARLGVLRRWSILLVVTFSLGLVAVDFAVINRQLAAVFAPEATMVNANLVVSLFQISQLVKGLVLIVSIIAAILALWPAHAHPLPARQVDPAL